MAEVNEKYPSKHDPEVTSRAILIEISRAQTWATIEAGKDALLTMRRISNSIRREMEMLNDKASQGACQEASK